MDRYSELEVKYKADDVVLTAYNETLDKIIVEATSLFAGPKKPGSFRKTVVGTDTFFRGPNDAVLRYRRAGKDGNDQPALTYKKRKHGGNSVDRVEVDMFVDRALSTEEDVRAWLGVLGFVEHFSILKESHIYKIPGRGHNAVVALYDVIQHHKISRYLEIEIDKDSACDDNEGSGYLNEWAERFQKVFPSIGRPTGKSLYELHAPRTELYVEGSF